MEHYKFLGKYAKKIIAAKIANDDEINVVPYFYSAYKEGTPCEHTHDFWELLFVVRGSLENKINGKKYILKERDVLLVKPQDRHQSYVPKGGSAEFYNFEIRESFFKQLLESINKSLYGIILEQSNIYIQSDEITLQQFRSFMAQINDIKVEEYKEKQMYLQMLIARIISDMLLKKMNSRHGYFLIEEIFTYMRSPDKMDASLVELAQTFGYCSEHILRIFKKNGLESPSKEWKKIKLNYACDLLEGTNYSIMGISEAIGIANVNYFSKIFKEYFNISPSEYRKKYKDEEVE